MYIGQTLRAEYQAAIQDVAWAQTEAGVLRIAGEERVKWLHKLVTAQIADLGVGEGVRSALLDAKGHFVADFDLWVENRSIGILAEPVALDSLSSSLRRYIIREKVIVQVESRAWHLFTLFGPEANQFLSRLVGEDVPSLLGSLNVTVNSPVRRFVTLPWQGQNVIIFRSNRARVPAIDVLVPAQHVLSITESLQPITRLSAESLEVLRVEAGVPKWGVDFDETTLALEIPPVMQIRVDQGCYVGQEVVARIVHRGHVNRHLRGLQIKSERVPPRGAAIRHEGRDVGIVTSAIFSPAFGAMAMGYVRREVAVGAEVQIGDEPEVTGVVTELPFVTAERATLPHNETEKIR